MSDRKRRIRNYRVMGTEKLQRCLDELVDRDGLAYFVCLKHGSGDVDRDVGVCIEELERRGLMASDQP